MAKRLLNSFNSGVLDALMLGRADIDQYANGLQVGTNVLLLPQGGARRRGGLKYIGTLTGPCRFARFRFNREQQYLLVLSNGLLEIYEDDALITQIVTPYITSYLGAVTWTQAADTMVMFHEDVAPHRLLRGALAANPITTDGSTTTVVVGHPGHGLADGTTIGISKITGAVGGVPVAELNTSHAIATIDGSLGTDPVSTTSTSRDVTVTITGHPFVIGERVEFTLLASTGGIPSSDFNRIVTITEIVDADTVKFEASNTAIANDTGGGALGTWTAPDKYNVTVTTASTSPVVGGGSVGKAWALADLSDETGDVYFKNVPKFDYTDSLSPPPNDEKQRISFGLTWATGNRYRLTLDNHRSGEIRYNGTDVDTNAQLIQDALRALARSVRFARFATTKEKIRALIEGGIEPAELTVTHETGAVGGSDSYFVDFGGHDGGRDWPLIEVEVLTTDSPGTISSSEVVKGGSRSEAAFSVVRGYPRTGAFFEGRLWMAGLKSRPATVLASNALSYFDLDVADANDGDGIDVTGMSDPILHLLAESSLFALTSSSEVALGGAKDEAITPDNVRFDKAGSYGSADVRPVVVGGFPLYVDQTNRNVRQLTYQLEADKVVSAELSVMSQDLINTPLDMDVLRNSDADYALIVMTDGTVAAMVYNPDQAVVGFTKLETSGSIECVATVDDVAYFSVLRTINGVAVRYVEKMDSAYYTDASEQATGAAATAWSGFEHLEAETVSVRGDQMTLTDATVSSGAITSSEEVTAIEVGIPFQTALAPMPPVVGRRTRVSRCEIDLVDSRAVLINGFKVKPKPPATVLGLPPLLNGLHAMPIRGWSERSTVNITQTEPQPMTVRSLLLEVE